MLSLTESFDLKADQVCVVALDPGWVRTELGGPNASPCSGRVSGGVCRAHLGSEARTIRKVLALLGQRNRILSRGSVLAVPLADGGDGVQAEAVVPLPVLVAALPLEGAVLVTMAVRPVSPQSVSAALGWSGDQLL